MAPSIFKYVVQPRRDDAFRRAQHARAIERLGALSLLSLALVVARESIAE